MKKYPDHVQLRLRMTSEEIEAERERCSKIETAPELLKRPEWDEVTKAVPPYGKTKNYWLRAAQTAREVAARKTEKKARRFWNRRATEYEEKANEVDSGRRKEV